MSGYEVRVPVMGDRIAGILRSWRRGTVIAPHPSAWWCVTVRWDAAAAPDCVSRVEHSVNAGSIRILDAVERLAELVELAE